MTNITTTRKLTAGETLRLLNVIRKEDPETDWLIFRLMAEGDFSLGEIVSASRGGSDLPGIQIEDLHRDEIHIVRAHGEQVTPVHISPRLMRRLHEYHGQRTSGLLFENIGRSRKTAKGERVPMIEPRGTISYRFADYRDKMGINDPDSVKSESIRGTLSKNQADLAEFDGHIAGEAIEMADFYALNYCLERSIRKLIIEVLEKKFGPKWWDATNPKTNEPVIPKTVKGHYGQIREKERKSETLIKRTGSQMDYLSYDDLMEIIGTNWDEFAEKFVLDTGNTFEPLVYLDALRNLIAHNVDLTGYYETKFRDKMNDWLDRLKSTSKRPE